MRHIRCVIVFVACLIMSYCLMIHNCWLFNWRWHVPHMSPEVHSQKSFRVQTMERYNCQQKQRKNRVNIKQYSDLWCINTHVIHKIHIKTITQYVDPRWHTTSIIWIKYILWHDIWSCIIYVDCFFRFFGSGR